MAHPWTDKWQPEIRLTYMPLPLSWKIVKSSEAKEGQFQAVEFFTYAFSLLSPIHVLGQKKSKDTIKKELCDCMAEEFSYMLRRRSLER